MRDGLALLRTRALEGFEVSPEEVIDDEEGDYAAHDHGKHSRLTPLVLYGPPEPACRVGQGCLERVEGVGLRAQGGVSANLTS